MKLCPETCWQIEFNTPICAQQRPCQHSARISQSQTTYHNAFDPEIDGPITRAVLQCSVVNVNINTRFSFIKIHDEYWTGHCEVVVVYAKVDLLTGVHEGPYWVPTAGFRFLPRFFLTRIHFSRYLWRVCDLLRLFWWDSFVRRRDFCTSEMRYLYDWHRQIEVIIASFINNLH